MYFKTNIETKMMSYVCDFLIMLKITRTRSTFTT